MAEANSKSSSDSVHQLIGRNLHRSFESAAGPLAILNDLSFELQTGENAAIVGPSGSGKSSLLHILGGLDAPTSGSVTLDGVNPYQLSPKQLASFRNRQVGFVFQEHYLLPQLTAMENVLVPLLAESAVDAESLQRAQQLLDLVGLGDRADHRPGQLSGGERQRVAVARALMMKPVLLLADEPTGNLDAANADLIGQLLCSVQEQQPTILICVTHSQSLADQFQRQWTLVGGRLQESTAVRSGSERTA